MKTETVLFIGGPIDGQRVEVEEGVGVWTVLKRERPRPVDFAKREGSVPEPIEKAHTRVNYERAEIAGGPKRFSVFRPPEWSGEQLIETLINNYVGTPS